MNAFDRFVLSGGLVARLETPRRPWITRRGAWAFLFSYLAAWAILGLWVTAWLGLNALEGIFR